MTCACVVSGGKRGNVMRGVCVCVCVGKRKGECNEERCVCMCGENDRRGTCVCM